jgi:hypothetical protein
LAKTRLTTSGTSMPVSSMSTEMAIRRSDLAVLELVDERLGTGLVVVDDATDPTAVLRIQLVENRLQQDGVVVAAAKMMDLPTSDPEPSRMPFSIRFWMILRLVSLLKICLST